MLPFLVRNPERVPLPRTVMEFEKGLPVASHQRFWECLPRVVSHLGHHAVGPKKPVTVCCLFWLIRSPIRTRTCGSTGVQTLGHHGSETPSLLLPLKTHLGANDPEVTAECLRTF